jgi:DNA-directed RNA polymerase specialized sigma24 family protein
MAGCGCGTASRHRRGSDVALSRTPAKRDGKSISDVGVDPDAFEAFYREHVGDVQRFVAHRADDPYLAADLTPDIALAVIKSASGYRQDSGSPRAWLFGIARNVVCMELRRLTRKLARGIGYRHSGGWNRTRSSEPWNAATPPPTRASWAAACLCSPRLAACLGHSTLPTTRSRGRLS